MALRGMAANVLSPDHADWDRRREVLQAEFRFWPLQGVEPGIFLILALALSVFTYWSVTTRET